MKKMQILIMITISLLLFYDFGFSQVAIEPKEIDPFLSTVDRLKVEGDFENWPCKNGPIRAGIILSKDDFSALQEAEDNIPNIYIMDWIEGILATQYSYRWTVKEKGIVDVELKVMQTCLQAQEFLIRRFAESSMPPEAIHLPPSGETCGINAGDVSFARMEIKPDSYTMIRFVRNNIYVEICANEGMRTEIKTIAEDLDQLLLSRPTGEEALDLIPVFKWFYPIKHPMKPDETSELCVEIEAPAGNYVELMPLEEGITIVTDVTLSNNHILFMWKATQGDIYLEKHDIGNNYYYCSYHYSSEIEGLHTITMIVSNRETGLISEAQITIEVKDDEKIDERFWDFLLTADEVSGYRIKKVYRSDCCPSSPDGLGYRVNQEWASIDEDMEIDLTMEIFDSEETAIRGMNIYMDTAEPWIWGSVYGGILGNHSWRSFNDNHAAIFTYGNIGIRMITNKPHRGESTLRVNQKAITDLAQSQIKKIDRNLAPEIIDYRESLRQTRLSPVEYDRYMAEAVNINLNGYQLITNEDSLWLLKDEGVRMGIRREWRNSQGKVIGVDICKLESNTMAEDTASERKEKMWIDYIVSKEPRGIIVHGSAVIHIYYLNHEYSIGPAYYSAPVSSSLNPIYYDRLGLPFPYFNNPYYNPGYYNYNSRFPATPYNNMSLRYPYNAILYQPNLPSYVWDSSVPFYKTTGYNYPVYYPERYAFPIKPKEPYGGYIFPYRYNSPIYSYSSSNPYPPLPSGIFNMLASSNLNTTLKGIELIHNYWPLY